MQASIALLRGINVGGRNVLTMAALKETFEQLGCTDVQTYIQSGNVVFQTADLARLKRKLPESLNRQIGTTPEVIYVSATEWRNVVNANPFPEATRDPKTVHAFFLQDTPDIDPKSLDALKSKSEAWRIVGDVFYLYAPDGVGRSRLANRAEATLGVATTARNWRTITRLLAMVDQIEASGPA
ncbi:MAG: DUF1697 domain-containing protein [Proteobacteria bacterium]|nr:DUF1697 domain-containing protein [Pseudomonadota bacterium]